MEKEIIIDSVLCRKCKVCTEICPMVIFRADKERTTVRPERAALCFTCGQCMAACPEKAIFVSGLDYDKDFFDLPETIDSFDSLIQSRRSIRAFKDKPVERELLEQIVEAMTYAPPGFPPLKTEITVIQDKELIRKSLPYMVSMWDGLLGKLKNPLIRLLIRINAGSEKLRTLQNHIVPMFTLKMPHMLDGTEDAITRNAQAMILFHANKQADSFRNDIYIALTYALLKAHSLGIGASAIDLIPPTIERTPFLKQLFHIPEQNEVVASVILGYPKYRYRRAIRRQLKSITWI